LDTNSVLYSCTHFVVWLRHYICFVIVQLFVYSLCKTRNLRHHAPGLLNCVCLILSLFPIIIRWRRFPIIVYSFACESSSLLDYNIRPKYLLILYVNLLLFIPRGETRKPNSFYWITGYRSTRYSLASNRIENMYRNWFKESEIWANCPNSNFYQNFITWRQIRK